MDKGLIGLREQWRTECQGLNNQGEPELGDQLSGCADELDPFVERLKGLVDKWQRQAREHEGNCDMALDAYADAQEACADQLHALIYGEKP